MMSTAKSIDLTQLGLRAKKVADALEKKAGIVSEPRIVLDPTTLIGRLIREGKVGDLALIHETAIAITAKASTPTGPTLTPEMDKLALDEGLLFTNLYASGNRTVRGFEGLLYIYCYFNQIRAAGFLFYSVY